jgi:hypothetical protein
MAPQNRRDSLAYSGVLYPRQLIPLPRFPQDLRRVRPRVIGKVCSPASTTRVCPELGTVVPPCSYFLVCSYLHLEPMEAWGIVSDIGSVFRRAGVDRSDRADFLRSGHICTPDFGGMISASSARPSFLGRVEKPRDRLPVRLGNSAPNQMREEQHCENRRRE